MIKKIILIFLLFFITTTEAAETIHLSIDQSIQKALEEGITARIAGLKVETSREKVNFTRADFLPQVKGEVLQYNQVLNYQTFIGGDIPGLPTKSNPFYVFDARINASVNFIDLSAFLRYQAAKQKIQVSQAEKEKIENNVAAAVATLYISVLRAETKVKEAESNIKLFKKFSTLSKHQLDVGVGTALDFQRTEVQLANQNHALLIAEEQKNRAKLALLHAIGESLSSDLILTDSLAEVLKKLPNLEETVLQAKESRPEMKEANEKIRNTQTSIAAEKAKRWPVFNAYFIGEYSGNTFDNLQTSRVYGFNISVPIFTGGRLRSELNQAQIEYQDALLKKQDTERQIEEELRGASLNYKTTQNRVKVAKQSLDLATKELEFTHDRYRNGVATTLEIDNAQTTFLNSQELYLSAKADQAQSYYELARASGKIRVLVTQGENR